MRSKLYQFVRLAVGQAVRSLTAMRAYLRVLPGLHGRLWLRTRNTVGHKTDGKKKGNIGDKEKKKRYVEDDRKVDKDREREKEGGTKTLSE